ncbi:hypothetical protein PMAYCL1PPCAC_33420, partial [Pristionchus mayeri]
VISRLLICLVNTMFSAIKKIFPFQKTMRATLVVLICACIVVCLSGEKTKKKKSLADYTEADLERLYDEWEENDEEKLEEDELPLHKQKPKLADLDELKNKAANPEELMKLSKKGQTLMMFVNVEDPERPGVKEIREFTDKWTGIWHSNLYNNHVDAQVFIIDDNRAIFMFKEGSQAFEAKDFLVKQPYVVEVSLEGQRFPGPLGGAKTEL